MNWKIFPWNIGNWHWEFFVISPKTLDQRFYDSSNGNLDTYKNGAHVSQCIHKWVKVKDYHRLRMGVDHLLQETEWSKELINDDQKLLKRYIQARSDCALYTVIQPFIIQDGLDLDVLGKTEEARKRAGVELRRRVLLLVFLLRGQLFGTKLFCYSDIVYKEKVARLKSLKDDRMGKSTARNKKFKLT